MIRGIPKGELLVQDYEHFKILILEKLYFRKFNSLSDRSPGNAFLSLFLSALISRNLKFFIHNYTA